MPPDFSVARCTWCHTTFYYGPAVWEPVFVNKHYEEVCDAPR